MRFFRSAMTWLFLVAAPMAAFGSEPGAGTPVKPRQHLLTIEGENHVTFVPAAGLDPRKVEYRARIEYLVKTRTGKEVEADTSSTASKKKTRSKGTRAAKKLKKADLDDEPAPNVASAVDLAVHAAEMDFLQNGETVVQSRITRARFEGRFMPEAPVLSVNYREGTYTVAGEQQYDPKSREWRTATWSVDVANDLANADGVTVAHAKGKMVVDSKMVGDSS
jgi:hypothetical protein